MRLKKFISVFAALFVLSTGIFNIKFEKTIVSRADYEFDIIDENEYTSIEDNDYDNDIIEFEPIDINENSSEDNEDSFNYSDTTVRSYNPFSAFIICLFIGLISAFIVVSIMKSSMKSVYKKQGASDYRKQNGFKLDVKADNFLGKRVEKSPIMRVDNSNSHK